MASPGLFASLKPMGRNTWNPKAETHPGDWLRLCCSRNSSDEKTLVKLARRATCHPIIYPLLSFNTIILSLWSHESLSDAQKSTPLSGMILRKKLARRATCHPIIYPLLSFNTIILSLWSHESLSDAQKSTPLSGMILRKVPLSGTV